MRLRPLAAGAAACLALLWGFWEVAEGMAGSATLSAMDTSVSRYLQAFRTPGLTVIMKVVTLLGSTPVVALVGVLLSVWLVLSHRAGDAVASALILSAGGLLSFLAKRSFVRERPTSGALIPLPESFSFPSGHTMASLCLAAVLAYLVMRSDRAPALKAVAVLAASGYALAVATSRVYLGVHWPSDVVAGWFLAGALVVAVIAVRESVQSGSID